MSAPRLSKRVANQPNLIQKEIDRLAQYVRTAEDRIEKLKQAKDALERLSDE